MKYGIVIIILMTFWGCKANEFFVGTYTDGASEGIYKYQLQRNGVLKRIGLAIKSENPSYLATSADKKYLVAVNEVDRENSGTVESYQIQGDSLLFVSRSKSGGAHPCFVTANDAGFVLTANYTGGNVGLHRLNQMGELSPLLNVQQHTGKGTTKRQQSPHAHSAWFVPMGNKVIAVDLGTNQLWFSDLDTTLQKLIPSDPPTLAMKPGAGPRHLAFHPSGKWIYVVNELDCTVACLKRSENEEYIQISSISSLPKNYAEPNTCADIRVSSDGRFVYASNRGHNSIVVYAVKDDGSLNLLGHEPTRGNGPRNFSLAPNEKYLLVANQYSNNIVSFKRDRSTGLLEYVGQIEAPTPVCLLFAFTK